MKTAKLTEDGRLLCPKCPGEQELYYHQIIRRRHRFKARFDKEMDRLFMVGKPDEYTLDVNEEYLHCTRCNGGFRAPWDENGDQEQDELKYEGDWLRVIKPEIPANECPRCKSKNIKLVELHEISTEILRKDQHPNGDKRLVIGQNEKIEYEREFHEKEHLECFSCFYKFSIPYGVLVETE